MSQSTFGLCTPSFAASAGSSQKRIGCEVPESLPLVP